MVVDLPAPLGPRKPSTSPLATVRSIPDTAVIEPNFLVRPWMMIMAAGGSKRPGNIGCVPLEKSLLRRKGFLCSKGAGFVTPARLAAGDDIDLMVPARTETGPEKGPAGEIWNVSRKVGRSRKTQPAGAGGLG